MDGKIYFKSVEDLAKFLVAFTGSTAKFEVQERNGEYILTFLGGF
jgi:hypothetical protein